MQLAASSDQSGGSRIRFSARASYEFYEVWIDLDLAAVTNLLAKLLRWKIKRSGVMLCSYIKELLNLFNLAK